MPKKFLKNHKNPETQRMVMLALVKKSLAKRLLLYLLVASSLITTVITLISFSVDYKNEMSGLEGTFLQIQKSSLKNMAQSVWDFNGNQINIQLNGYLQINDIVKAYIKDDQGMVIYQQVAPERSQENLVEREFSLEYSQGSGTKETIGKLFIVATKTDIYKRLAFKVTYIFVSQGLKTFLISFIILFIFRSLVTRHIEKIASFLVEYDVDEKGDIKALSLDRQEHERDELDILVDAIRKMGSNLEDKVEERTTQLKREKELVFDLLHSMQQSVFTISSDLLIVPPVSKYSASVFGIDLVGKNVLDVLYKDLDPKSDKYSLLKLGLEFPFGEDHIQWLLVEDNLLSEVHYYPPATTTTPTTTSTNSTQSSEYKTLKVTYSPLWNEEKKLEKIMFVVEDLTNEVKIKREMKTHQEEAKKKIKRINELLLLDYEDILNFLYSNTDFLFRNEKEFRPSDRDKTDFGPLLRGLHTLKGNSRVFKMSYLSHLTHKVEDEINELIKAYRENKMGQEELGQKINIQKSGLLNEVYEYAYVGHNVLHYSMPILTKMEKFVHQEFIKLEESLKNRDYKSLREAADRCHFSFLSINHQELVQKLKKFEGGISQNPDVQQMNLDFHELRQCMLQFYVSSTLYKAYSIDGDLWSALFKELYHLSQRILGGSFHLDLKNKDMLSENIRQMMDLVVTDKMVYFNLLVKNLNWFTSEKSEDKDIEALKINIGHLWKYLMTSCGFYHSQMISDPLKMEIKAILSHQLESEEPGNWTEELDSWRKKDLLLEILYNLRKNDIQINDLLTMYNHFVTPKKPWDVLVDLIIGMQIPSFSSPDQKKIPHKPNLNLFGSAFPIYGDLLGMESITDNYLVTVDFLQLLGGVENISNLQKEKLKVPTTEIIDFNLQKLKDIIFNPDRVSLEEFKGSAQKAFLQLFEVPIGPSLAKYSTMIKEWAEKNSKSIDFVIKGEDVTLEKDKLQRLEAVFVHLIRNSIDHGLETREERRKKGKNEEGVLEIVIQRENDHVINIVLKDDGKGIDIGKVAQKAINMNMITPDKLNNMSPQEILDLIFLPNLSTREDVTEISGRGVGMDIVKKTVEELHGDIRINTELEKKTEFIISLPA